MENGKDNLERSESEDDEFRVALKNNNWRVIERFASNGFYRAYYPLARHYFTIQKYDEALRWIKEALGSKRIDEKAEVLLLKKDVIAEDAYEKAERYFKEKQWDKSLAYAQKAISLTESHKKRLEEIIIQCKRWNPPTYEINDYN